MAIVATCSCGKSFSARPDLAGKTVRCPSCGGGLRIPQASAPAVDDPLGLGSLNDPALGSAAWQQPTMPVRSVPTSPPDASVRRKTQPSAKPWLFIALGLGTMVGVIAVAALLIFAVALPALRNIGQPGGQAPGGGDGKIAGSWQSYISPSGHYSVAMPGQAKTHQEIVRTALGSQEIAIAVVEDERAGAFTVVHSSFPPEASAQGPDAVLDGAIQGQLASVNGTLHATELISYQGHPGREIRYEGTSRAGVATSAHARLYAVQNTLYQVFWVGPRGQEPAEDVSRFLDSFELTDPPPASPDLSPRKPPPALVKDTASPSRPPDTRATSRRETANLTEDQRRRVFAEYKRSEQTWKYFENEAEKAEREGELPFVQSLRQSAEKHKREGINRLISEFGLTRDQLLAIAKEGEQKRWKSEWDDDSFDDKPAPDPDALTEDRRRNIYQEWLFEQNVFNQSRAAARLVNDAVSTESLKRAQAQAKTTFLNVHGITENQLDEILAEGREKNWGDR